MRHLLIFILFLSTLSSCTTEDLFRNNREDYSGDNFRLDGFYYAYAPDGYIKRVSFYYRNGIEFSILTNSKDISDPAECVSLLTNERIENSRSFKDSWGIFKIKEDNFIGERWSSSVALVYFTIVRTGKVLSDTKYIITKTDHSEFGTEDVYVEYHFYPFSPKPDSTNVFIE